ncbi:unnamed protein product, partial [Sphenostylis stenocarpa]
QYEKTESTQIKPTTTLIQTFKLTYPILSPYVTQELLVKTLNIEGREDSSPLESEEFK